MKNSSEDTYEGPAQSAAIAGLCCFTVAAQLMHMSALQRLNQLKEEVLVPIR